MTKLSEQEVNDKLAFIKANQKFEGYILSPEDIQNAHDVLTGTRCADDIIAELVKKYSPAANFRH